MFYLNQVKFLHCADIHLDMPFHSIGSDNDRSCIRRQDLKECFEKIIRIAIDHQVDILLIAGDLYEHSYVKRSTIGFINDLFGELGNARVFIVPGNHDPFIINSYYHNFQWNRNVHILTESNPYVVMEDLRACIYGVGFKSFFQEEPLIKDINSINKKWINIMLSHGTVDMNFGKNPYNPMTSEFLGMLGMDYIALGHFHTRMENVGGYKVIYNPGSPEPLGFDETGEHGVYLGSIMKDTTGESSLKLSFIKTGKKFYQNLEVCLDGCDTDEKVTKRIMDTIQCGDAHNGLYCITLKGYLEKDYHLDVSQIHTNLKDRYFFVKIKDETYLDYNFDEIMREPGLRGVFSRKMLERISGTEDKDKRRLLMNALYYGIEALDRGKIDIYNNMELFLRG